jgi:hypothetical protein
MNVLLATCSEKVKEAISVRLAGDWRVKQIQRLPASPSSDKGHADAGISEEAKLAVAADFNDAAWQTVQVPRNMDSYGPTWKDADGEAVFVRSLKCPVSCLDRT